ncbi:hypothetical protein [Nocardia vinacea]|uniref:hypothetical protein n=1 Tax=Nocardia vinacea TaxID=96468 RepID=UPI0012F67F64|nr:hypothetical protein [Nocardia vinacea]
MTGERGVVAIPRISPKPSAAWINFIALFAFVVLQAQSDRIGRRTQCSSSALPALSAIEAQADAEVAVRLGHGYPQTAARRTFALRGSARAACAGGRR